MNVSKEENKEKLNRFEEYMSKGANNNVAMIPQDTSIRTAVELMVKYKISSVLIHDPNEEITGIITEKDIIQKFTLLDFNDKLEKKALTLASRPVLFVKQQTYQEDVIKIHLEKGIHHFPISMRENPKTSDIVGIISIGDFLRKFILANKEDKTNEKAEENLSDSVRLFFLNGSGEKNSKSIECLEALGVKIKRINDFHSFYNENKSISPPIMFDIDSFPVKETKILIQTVKKYQGPSIFITQNANLVRAFRMHLNPDHQVISLKPIDYCYFYWLLKHKWS